MKKILLVLITIAMCAMTTNAQVPSTLGDTLSIYVGTTVGNMIARSMPEKFNQESFFRAFEETIKQENDSSAIAGKFMAAAVVGIITNAKEKYGINANTDVIIAEVKKALAGDTLTLEKYKEMEEGLNNLEQRMEEEKYNALANSPEAIANKKNGDRFVTKKLIANKYTRTESGLLYRVIKRGNGNTFATSDNVLVTYKGSLINGTVVELEEEGRVVVPENVTPGCCEMLTLMKPGMKVEAIIPGELAYGVYGNPDRGIGPNETLVFEIEAIGLAAEEEDLE